MRILNAISPKGKLFNEQGIELLHPEWPEDGHLNCLQTCDQALFSFLQNTTWANDKIIASARWREWSRSDTRFTFRGSGIHFYYLEGDTIVRDKLHFVCEVPWKEIFDRDGDEYTFVGAFRFRDAYIYRVMQAASGSREHIADLKDKITAERIKEARLTVATFD